jgi:hypothetical protein
VLIVAGAVAALSVTSASAQTDPEQQREQVRDKAAAVAGQVDALEAKDAQVRAALDTIDKNLATQRAKLDRANRAKADADAALRTAQESVARAKQRFEQLDAAADSLVVESYVTPVGDEALDAFRADSLTDAAVKRTLQELTAESDQRLLDQLARAREELAADQERKRDAASDAAATRAAAGKALTRVRDARAEQARFVADVEARLDAKLAEAEALRKTDAALSRQIAAEQAALAARLPAVRAPGGGAPTTIAGVPGGLATVDCPGGGSITVAGSIADNLAALLGRASSVGVNLCGGGYRDPQEQIALRREHCGTSDYAIYQMPASQCDPPTARPGTSEHEQGLAIDFTCNGGGTVSYGDVCWNWLSAHAGEYGFINLPSEPWHWSTTGR